MEQLRSIRPLGERVVVKREKAEEKKFGAIIIPQNAADTDPSFIAEVIAVGPGRELSSKKTSSGLATVHKWKVPDVKPGDRVIIGKYSGTEVQIDGEKFVTVMCDDLLGVIEGDGAS